jgi:hypothetical protein
MVACGADTDQPMGAQPVSSPAIFPLPPDASSAAPEQSSAAPTDLFLRNAEGVVLPDPERTPGAIFEDVQAADICDLHYTQGIRQPRFNAKVSAFASYGLSIHDRERFDVDHLIPVSLGGNNDDANLWPQPFDEEAGAQAKDLLERQLRGLVCSEYIPLQEAQQAIAKDWWTAFQTYMGRPVKPGSEGLPPPEPFDPKPGEVANGGPCEVAGAIGYTEQKHVKLTCTATSSGDLRWQKRY